MALKLSHCLAILFIAIFDPFSVGFVSLVSPLYPQLSVLLLTRELGFPHVTASLLQNSSCV